LPQVDGSLGSWTYLLTCLYAMHDQPELTVEAAYSLLPLAHKYDFSKALAKLVRRMERKPLSHVPAASNYVVRWMELADRLHLEELQAKCLATMRQLAQGADLRERMLRALAVPAPDGGTWSKQDEPPLRQEVAGLSPELKDRLISILLASNYGG
jgi:hypothetical protein